MSERTQADILADFERRLMSQLAPSLNAGTAMEMLILVGQTIREMRASSAPPEPPAAGPDVEQAKTALIDRIRWCVGMAAADGACSTIADTPALAESLIAAALAQGRASGMVHASHEYHARTLELQAAEATLAQQAQEIERVTIVVDAIEAQHNFGNSGDLDQRIRRIAAALSALTAERDRLREELAKADQILDKLLLAPVTVSDVEWAQKVAALKAHRGTP